MLSEVNTKLRSKSTTRASVGSGEERATLSSDANNVWARLPNPLLCMKSVNYRNIETSQFVDEHAETDSLSGNREHSLIVTDKDDLSGWRQSSLNDSYDIRDGPASQQWPHGEVLKASWRRRELIVQGVVLHVYSNKAAEPWSREAKNARDLFGREEINGLVPANSHGSKVITREIVQRYLERKLKQ